MRTNIDIDDELMASALKAGPYKTKKDAVEAGLKMITRQAAYREILKWQGKLHWDGDAWAEPDRYATPQSQPRPKVAAPKVDPAAKLATKPASKPAVRRPAAAVKKRVGDGRR